MDIARGRAVRDDGTEVRLTNIEAKLLSYLVAHPVVGLSRQTLLMDVWGYATGVASRTVDITVHRLRRKLEVDPANPRHFVSLYGERDGLHLAPEVWIVGRTGLARVRAHFEALQVGPRCDRSGAAPHPPPPPAYPGRYPGVLRAPMSTPRGRSSRRPAIWQPRRRVTVRS